MKNIPFNIPYCCGQEEDYLREAIQKRHFSGDGHFTRQCSQWIERYTASPRAFLTTSCTHALEMAALLGNIGPGDEVIMPSFTFVSSANPFVLRGARIVFADIRPDTMNLDENRLEAAITKNTRAIVPVHYAGVGARMDVILEIARQHRLWVFEDAAQGINARFQGQHLGAIGHLGAISFHDTKSIHCGEGGVLLVNDETLAARAEIIREKGTNRSSFFRGEIDKYTWVDVGSSYLPSELNAAFLYPQLLHSGEVKKQRLALWQQYYALLQSLAAAEKIALPVIPADCDSNGYLFYIKCRDEDERQLLIDFLKQNGIRTAFHYIPLHSSPAGRLYGRFAGEDVYTTRESSRLLRLPLYVGLSPEDVAYVVEKITFFYKK